MHALIFVILWATLLASCAEPKLRPSGTVSATLSQLAERPELTAKAARDQKWTCQRIERAIVSLSETMRVTRKQAEEEQQALAPTIARMFARASGAPGAGNAALAEFHEAQRDAEQLNALLREKGCPSRPVGNSTPEWSTRTRPQ